MVFSQGQTNVDNYLLTLSFQVVLGHVKLKIKTNYNKELNIES